MFCTASTQLAPHTQMQHCMYITVHTLMDCAVQCAIPHLTTGCIRCTNCKVKLLERGHFLYFPRMLYKYMNHDSHILVGLVPRKIVNLVCKVLLARALLFSTCLAVYNCRCMHACRLLAFDGRFHHSGLSFHQPVLVMTKDH